MNNKKIIGIGGVARSGKNLFADIAGNVLKEKYNKTCKSFALAYYLKKDCEEFIKQKLNMDVWSELTDEKNVFRPLLVWYGGVKRKQTNGRYWIEMLQKDFVIAISKSDMLDDELKEAISKELPKNIPHIFISSVTGYHLQQLKDLLWNTLNATPINE